MALIKCPECGKEISDKAKACIFCGYPIPMIKQSEPIKQNDTLEPINHTDETNLAEPVQETTHSDMILTEKQPVNHQMDEQQKKKITIAIVVIIVAILAIWGFNTAVNNKTARQRDLSDVFDFSFDMTIDDVIAYESQKYGNTEYERENLSDKIRLDFEKYSYNDWKHRYFFDKKTGLLTSVHYSGVIITFGDKDEAECEHVRPLKRALLNEIGEWDEKPTGDSVRSVAYGQIDGVPCKILYFDYATQEISISTTDD